MPHGTRGAAITSVALCIWAAAGLAPAASGQTPGDYTAPRTLDGQPDLGGVWSLATLTPMERPEDVATTAVSEAEAEQISARFAQQFYSGVTDPDFTHYGSNSLMAVDGEYRAAFIVAPDSGQLPYTPEAQARSVVEFDRFLNAYDHPEERPMSERCIGGSGSAPMRLFPIVIPREIFQTEGYVILRTEDVDGTRIIELDGAPPPANLRSVAGYSSGSWEGHTLVVRTTHLSADFPYREGLGRAVQVSEDSVVIERFTRLSPDELLYQFTVDDPDLYAEPWLGEFVLRRDATPVWEYACHEANYSMKGVLLGGRFEQARVAAAR